MRQTSTAFSLVLHGLTATLLVGAVWTVFVSVTLQDLWETLAHVPTWELAERASRLLQPVGQQH